MNCVAIIYFKLLHLLLIHRNKCSFIISLYSKLHNSSLNPRKSSTSTEKISEGKSWTIDIDGKSVVAHVLRIRNISSHRVRNASIDIQKWVDHSISVTINLPNDVDEDLVNRLYVEAWKSGCKGCTVYRDGSRSGVLISTKSDKKSELPPCKPPTVVETRPRILDADVVRFQNNKEKWVARDCIGVTIDYILKWFDIPIDMEEAIRERDW